MTNILPSSIVNRNSNKPVKKNSRHLGTISKRTAGGVIAVYRKMLNGLLRAARNVKSRS